MARVLFRRLTNAWVDGLEEGELVCWRDLRAWILRRNRKLRAPWQMCLSAMRCCPYLEPVNYEKPRIWFKVVKSNQGK